MDWSGIEGGQEFVSWFEDAPVCFHDAEIASICHRIPTNAAVGTSSRSLVLVYLYRWSAAGDRREVFVELDFENVRSFQLESDFAGQMVLDEIALEERAGEVRAEFHGIVGIGGHIAAGGLSVRLRPVGG
ncbi:MAG: hypothetical protein JNK48_02255 [Bryobacterales bacterium]|nr:hypothetical protein [Bryobacterales bacterium]